MFCKICAVQVHPRKHVPLIDHAGYAAPARQHKLDATDATDHTDHTDHADHTDHTDHLAQVWNG